MINLNKELVLINKMQTIELTGYMFETPIIKSQFSTKKVIVQNIKHVSCLNTHIEKNKFTIYKNITNVTHQSLYTSVVHAGLHNWIWEYHQPSKIYISEMNPIKTLLSDILQFVYI